MPIGILALFAIAMVLHIPTVRIPHKIDVLGLTLLSAGVTAIILLTTWGGAEYAWLSPEILGMGALSIVLLAAFCYVETRAEEPIIPLDLFKIRTFSVASAVSFAIGFTMFGAIVYMPLYLQVVQNSSPTKSGLQLLPMVAGMLTTFIVSGRLVSRTGRYKIFPIMGTFVVAVGSTPLSELNVSTPYWHVAIDMFVVGLGLGLVMQVLVVAVQNSVPHARLGTATSTATFCPHRRCLRRRGPRRGLQQPADPPARPLHVAGDPKDRLVRRHHGEPRGDQRLSRRRQGPPHRRHQPLAPDRLPGGRAHGARRVRALLADEGGAAAHDRARGTDLTARRPRERRPRPRGPRAALALSIATHVALHVARIAWRHVPQHQTLRGLEPPATPEEIEAAARQYVRKVSGVQKPTAATVEEFERAVSAVAAATSGCSACSRHVASRRRPCRRCAARTSSPRRQRARPTRSAPWNSTCTSGGLTGPAVRRDGPRVRGARDARRGARRAHALVHGPLLPDGVVAPATDPMLEGYTALGFVAGLTERLRLRLLVTGVTYRHPGLLAKIVTTLDVLSAGGAELGIGAAWYEREHVGLGVPFPPMAERFERLEEALQICLQMWSDDDGPFEGVHYQLAETPLPPRP